jgi:adenylate cyclase
MTERGKSPAPLGEPFPIRKRFRLRVVPAFLGFVGISLVIVGFTARQAVEAIYLELAQRRAQTIERAVSETAPKAWMSLMAGPAEGTAADPASAAELAGAFSREVRRQDLLELKVYDLSRKVLYATNADEIGTSEDGSALREAISRSEPGVVLKVLADGTEQYELYVPVYDDGGVLRAVFELYEPVDYLDSILLEAAIPIVVIPALLFLALGFASDRLVSRAQSDIDERTGTIDELRKRLESFVSSSAAAAARRAIQSDRIPSSRMTTTLFYSDVRDFTGFCEIHSPEEVVDFLNELMTLQLGIIVRYDGDVDKMIGDAVLARFDGDDGGVRAIAAAREIQSAVALGGFARQLGIGIYRGNVVSGTVGPDNRRDFTVIGDAVNVAARLCSEAKRGEIVVQAELADDRFEGEASVYVKGRELPVAIRRQSRLDG